MRNCSFPAMEIFHTAFTIGKPNAFPQGVTNVMILEKVPAVRLRCKTGVVAMLARVSNDRNCFVVSSNTISGCHRPPKLNFIHNGQIACAEHELEKGTWSGSSYLDPRLQRLGFQFIKLSAGFCKFE